MTSPAPTATIRDARESDIARILELYKELSEQSTIPEESVREVTAQHHATLREITTDPRMRLLVLEEGSRVIGTLTLYVLPSLSHGGNPFAIVENVVVDSETRGGGYGKLLMTRAEELAAAAGCYKVSLTSNLKRAPAHAFYERIGYTHSHKGFSKYGS